MFQYVMKSDTGKKREVNEDRVAVLKRPEGLLLAVVADGMGGHQAGDVAAEMTVNFLTKQFVEESIEAFSTTDSKVDWLNLQVKTINKEVYDYSLANPGCKGMGTTLIAALIDQQEGVLCHVGDSRAYMITDTAEQLTRDHSYVNVLVDSGEISQEEAENHPQKNWIIKALGTEEEIDGEIIRFSFAESAYLLLCSDGLSNKIPKVEMEEIVRSSNSLAEKGEKFIKLANHLGGEDNISLVLLTSKAEEV